MNQKNTQKTKYRAVIIVLIVLLLGCAACFIYGYMTKKEAAYTGSSASIDENASEWDDGLNEAHDIEDQILVPGYSGAKMQEGTTDLKLRIGNPEENHCCLKATLCLSDGTVLYESGLIEPGKGFEEVTLNQTLAAGSYEAYVHYQGYSMDEEPEILNSCDSAFTLTVTKE